MFIIYQRIRCGLVFTKVRIAPPTQIVSMLTATGKGPKPIVRVGAPEDGVLARTALLL